MKLKFAGILMIAAFLAACASKHVAGAEQPAPPVAVELEGVKESSALEPSPAEGVATTEAVLTPEEILNGKNLYEGHCANCHKLFKPTDFTQKEWTPILVRMQKKARLDDSQMATITNYISSELNK